MTRLLAGWKRYDVAMLPKAAAHARVSDSVQSIRSCLSLKNRILMARWTEDFDSAPSNFWYIIKDKADELSDLSSNTRSKVRRGLKHCRIEPISKLQLAEIGYSVFKASYARYKHNVCPQSESEFKSHIAGLGDDIDVWAVYLEEGGELIAYSFNRNFGDACDYTSITFHPDYLKLYPSYALFYTMNSYYLGEKGMKYVNDGARSISHESNIQEFLIEKFKFRKAYCALRIEYHPLLAVLISITRPFRFVFRHIPLSIFHRIEAVQKQEDIRRGLDV